MKTFLYILGKPLCYILIALFVCACSNEETPEPPLTADFSFEVYPSRPEIIIFTNQSKSAQYYLWEFGDGHGTDEESPTHWYPRSSGTYEVTLTAYYSQDGSGKFPGSGGGLGKKVTKQIVINM